MSFENQDRRVIGAVQPMDVNTKLPIRGPFSVRGEGLIFRRNRSGLQVLTGAAGFEAYVRAFDAPPAPAAVKIPVTAVDGSGSYLPRSLSLTLPRSLDPKAADSVFQPIPIEMYPSPTVSIAPGWAVYRATIMKDGTTNERLPWAWIRVTQTTDGKLLARALADARGEAIVAVPGLAMVSPSEKADAVVASDVDISIDIAVDAATVAGEIEANKTGRHVVVNPDALSALPAAQTLKRTVKAGQIISETWNVPAAFAGIVTHFP